MRRRVHWNAGVHPRVTVGRTGDRTAWIWPVFGQETYRVQCFVHPHGRITTFRAPRTIEDARKVAAAWLHRPETSE